MPGPGKVMRPSGRASSGWSLRLNGATLRWRIQFGLKTICATLQRQPRFRARQEAEPAARGRCRPDRAGLSRTPGRGAVLAPRLVRRDGGNGFNLNIPRYVDTFGPEPEIDLQAVQNEIRDLERQLAETRMEMNRYLAELGIDV